MLIAYCLYSGTSLTPGEKGSLSLRRQMLWSQQQGAGPAHTLPKSHWCLCLPNSAFRKLTSVARNLPCEDLTS